MNLTILEEPELEFGGANRHVDIRFGNGIPMVEMPHLVRVEGNRLLATIHAHCDTSVVPKLLNGAEVAVCHAKIPVRCGQLYPVPFLHLPPLTVCGALLYIGGFLGSIASGCDDSCPPLS
jgi:hypothetical protein